MKQAVNNLQAVNRTRQWTAKYVVAEVTGDTVSLDIGDDQVAADVECLNSYTDRAAGDVVRVIYTSPVTMTVLGSVPATAVAEEV